MELSERPRIMNKRGEKRGQEGIGVMLVMLNV